METNFTRELLSFVSVHSDIFKKFKTRTVQILDQFRMSVRFDVRFKELEGAINFSFKPITRCGDDVRYLFSRGRKKKKKIPRTGAPVYLRNVHITFFLVIHSGYNSYSRARISRKEETCTEGATSKLAFRSDSSESSLLRDIIITREACIF